MKDLSNIIIDGITIRQDGEGRYSLNDLHRAAGGEKRHQPANWLRSEQTQALIAELEKPVPQIRGTEQNQSLIESLLIPGIPGVEQIQPLAVYQGGSFQGTYASKDLIYDYAMWISPAFKVKVIRIFDAVMRAILTEQRYSTLDRPDLKKMILDLQGENRALEKENITLKDELAARLPVLALRFQDGPAHLVLFQGQPYIVADHAARIVRQFIEHQDANPVQPDSARQVLSKYGLRPAALAVLKLKPLMERYEVSGGIVCHAFGVSGSYRSITLLPVWRMAEVHTVWPEFWPWLCRVALPLVPSKPELNLKGGAA